MGTPFQALPPFFPLPFDTPRGDDKIVILLENTIQQQEFKAPLTKKQRNSDETPSNPPQNPLSIAQMPFPSIPPNSLKRVNSLFFRSRLCAKFKSGSCPNGNNCNFAHGPAELRKQPPNWQDIVAGECENRSKQQRSHNNKICRKFYRGEVCPYGDRCTFMHIEPGTLRESPAISTGASLVMEPGDNNGSALDHTDSIVVVGSTNGFNQKPESWKTRICNKWEIMGCCPFGEKCHFAHGNAELKKFRGQMELDSANAVAAPSKPLPESKNVISSSITKFSCKPQAQQKQGFLKWEWPQMISHIYADWIDDIPLFARTLPTDAGT